MRLTSKEIVEKFLLIKMDVWNDSAERMLLRAGLCDPWTMPE
ncbi:MAG: hypothetical protein Q8O85_13625 [Rhodoferax sp.]|nr:hypothetical protein [Rhodoferax sp.]MDP2679744.1 hypothetical protein [Rhodoferax sp.]